MKCLIYGWGKFLLRFTHAYFKVFATKQAGCKFTSLVDQATILQNASLICGCLLCVFPSFLTILYFFTQLPNKVKKSENKSYIGYVSWLSTQHQWPEVCTIRNIHINYYSVNQNLHLIAWVFANVSMVSSCGLKERWMIHTPMDWTVFRYAL